MLLTVWLHPKKGGELDVDALKTLGAISPLERAYADRKLLWEQTDADPADVQRLREYCASRKIDIVESHWRSLTDTRSARSSDRGFRRDGRHVSRRQRGADFVIVPQHFACRRDRFGRTCRLRLTSVASFEQAGSPAASLEAAPLRAPSRSVTHFPMLMVPAKRSASCNSAGSSNSTISIDACGRRVRSPRARS